MRCVRGWCSDVLLAVSARMDKREEQSKSEMILLVLNVSFCVLGWDRMHFCLRIVTGCNMKEIRGDKKK